MSANTAASTANTANRATEPTKRPDKRGETELSSETAIDSAFPHKLDSPTVESSHLTHIRRSVVSRRVYG